MAGEPVTRDVAPRLPSLPHLSHARHNMAANPASNEETDHQQRYQRLLEAVTDYVFHVRVEDGRAVETVHASNCEAVTGYAPREFHANEMLWIAMVPLEDRALVEQQAACILAGRDAAPIEHRIRRKDGCIRWVLNTVSAQRDGRGQVIGYDGLLRDITDRREAEQRLRENEEFGRQVVSSLQEGLIVFDHDLRFRSWNRFMEQLSGLAADQVLGRHPDELFPWMREQGILGGVSKALAGKSLVQPDVLIHDAGAGKEVWVTGSSVPLRDAQERIVGVITTLQDISDRKRAEDALRQLNETLEYRVAQQMREIRLLAEAVSNLGEGVMITSDELEWPGPTIVFVNKAMCRISGYRVEELVRQTPRILHGDGTESETLNRIRTELSAGHSCLVELTNYRKNGTPYDAELFITPLVDAQGRRTNFVSIHRDITERKELQKHVLNIAGDEQRRIGQELHDGIGQELTGLSLFAGTLFEVFEGLAQQDVDGKATWVLEETDYLRLRQTASRLSRGLVEANQHVHQLSHGIMPVQIDAEGLRSALQELAASTDGQQNVRCWFECPDPLTVANNVVARHLYRIAQEALSNALRHGQADQIRIALSQKDGYLVLDVSDNGIGFDPGVTHRTGRTGMGLRTMNYRASLIGGVVHITRGKEGGMSVRCTVLLGGGRE